MTEPLRQLAGRLGIARAEHLAELAERTVRLARTVLHANQDDRPLPYAVNFSYTSTIDAVASEVAEFRALVSAIKTAIPTH
jgi:hypothetical protein